MKKISFILVISIILGMFSVTALAAGATTASITNASANAGDQVTLTLSIKNSPGIAGTQFYIGYDSSVMSYVSATAHTHSYTETVMNAGTDTEYKIYDCKCGHSYRSDNGVVGSFFAAFSLDAGANPVKVVTANLSLNNVTGDFTVADITFKINDDAKSGDYDVSLSSVEIYAAPYNEETKEKEIVGVAVEVENAVVTVKGKTTSVGTVHKHSYSETVVEPVGAEPGYTEYKCSCGHTYKGNYVYAETDVPVATPDTPSFEKQRDYTDAFVDVTTDKWFYDYVKTAYEYKLANGTSATKFSPDNKFTVAQALTAAANIHTVYSGKTVRAAAEGEAWYVPYVEYCVENGIITESQFANFDANITRGDMAVVFANILPDSEYAAVRSGAPADVIEESAVYLSVKKLYEAGIVSGDSGTGNYRPDDEIVRSEACVIFTRIAAADKRAK